jgi:hypothetical protein
MEQLDQNLIIQMYSQKLAEAQHQIIVLTAMIEQLKNKEQLDLNNKDE